MAPLLTVTPDKRKALVIIGLLLVAAVYLVITLESRQWNFWWWKYVDGSPLRTLLFTAFGAWLASLGFDPEIQYVNQRFEFYQLVMLGVICLALILGLTALVVVLFGSFLNAVLGLLAFSAVIFLLTRVALLRNG